MFEHFTETAREAVVLAADEARGLGHDHIGTEHLLLGLVRLGDPSISRLGLSLSATRTDVRVAVGAGSGGRTIGELRFTRAAKRVLDHADEIGGPDGTGPADLLSVLLGEEGAGAKALVGDNGASAPRDDGDDLLELAANPASVTARALAQLGVDQARLRAAVAAVRRR